MEIQTVMTRFPCPYRPPTPPPRPGFCSPNRTQRESGIRTLYDLGKGITLFGVLVPLMTFTGVWYKLILAVTAGVAFFATAWALEARHGSSL